ncbi:MAG: hypothetical protein KA165_16590, partial [Saprospiraceae bacterium]|nr:hypothetical protein [Saprospiraceae bacterium]
WLPYLSKVPKKRTGSIASKTAQVIIPAGILTSSNSPLMNRLAGAEGWLFTRTGPAVITGL